MCWQRGTELRSHRLQVLANDGNWISARIGKLGSHYDFLSVMVKRRYDFRPLMIVPTSSAVISLSGVALIVGALTVKPSSIARSEEHTSELQSQMRIPSPVSCLK